MQNFHLKYDSKKAKQSMNVSRKVGKSILDNELNGLIIFELETKFYTLCWKKSSSTMQLTQWPDKVPNLLQPMLSIGRTSVLQRL